MISFFNLGNISINIIFFEGKHDSNNNLVEVINKLKTKHNCNVEVSTDEANNFNGIFIQDRFMAESFHAFPEVIFYYNLKIYLKLQNYIISSIYYEFPNDGFKGSFC